MCTFIEMDDSEIIKFLNDPESIMEGSTTEKRINKVLTDAITNNQDFRLLLKKWKIDSTIMLNKLLNQICTNEISEEVRKVFFLENIIQNMMDLNTETQIRDHLIEVAFIFCTLSPISTLSEEDFKVFFQVLCTKYIPAISHLRDSNYDNWHKLWIFLVRFCAKKIHNSMDLTNKLLRIVEFAFRNSSVEQRLKGYDCWKELIDNASLNPQHICSSKQIKLLVTPLRAKFSKQEVVICKRFDIFVYLLEKLQKKAILCVNDFLEFCFGSIGNNGDNSRTGQVKSVPIMWTKSASVLIGILGHSHLNINECIAEGIHFENPIINEENFKEFYQIIIHSIVECCNLLKTETLENKANVLTCLWKSVFKLTLSANNTDKKLYIAKLTSVLDNYLEPPLDVYYQDLLIIIFKILISLNGDVLEQSVSLFFKQLVTIFLSVNIRSDDFTNILSKIFTKEVELKNKINMLETILNCILDEKNHDKNLRNFASIWTLISIEIAMEYDLEKIKNLSQFEDFFMWPLKNMHKLEDLSKKQILLINWTKLYKKVTLDNEIKKLEIISNLGKLFKNNPLLTPNILSILNVMSQFENNFDKNFIMKTMEVIKSILEMPNLSKEDENKLTIILVQYFDVSLECYKSENIDSLIECICSCINYILSIHSDLKIIEPLAKFLNSCSDNLKNIFSNNLKSCVSDLYKKEIDSGDNNKAKEFYKILAIFSEENQTMVDTKILVPSGRSARIATLGKNLPLSPHKSTSTNTVLQLFGKDPETMTPLKVKGSQLNNSLVTKVKKGANVITVKTPKNKPINEENSMDFVRIDSKVELQPDKLSEHQKDVLKKKREDIPALYQDLSQSVSQDLFVFNTPLDKTIDSVACGTDSFSQSQKRRRKSEPIKRRTVSPPKQTNKTNKNIKKSSPKKPSMDPDLQRQHREINRLKMDIVGAESFLESPNRRRIKKVITSEDAQEREECVSKNKHLEENIHQKEETQKKKQPEEDITKKKRDDDLSKKIHQEENISKRRQKKDDASKKNHKEDDTHKKSRSTPKIESNKIPGPQSNLISTPSSPTRGKGRIKRAPVLVDENTLKIEDNEKNIKDDISILSENDITPKNKSDLVIKKSLTSVKRKAKSEEKRKRIKKLNLRKSFEVSNLPKEGANSGHKNLKIKLTFSRTPENAKKSKPRRVITSSRRNKLDKNKSLKQVDIENTMEIEPKHITAETPIVKQEMKQKKLEDFMNENSKCSQTPENIKEDPQELSEDIIESSQQTFVEYPTLLNSSKKRSLKIEETKIADKKIDNQVFIDDDDEFLSIQEFLKNSTNILQNNEESKVTNSQATTISQDNSVDTDTLSDLSTPKNCSIALDLNDKEKNNSPEPPKKPTLTDSELFMCQMDTMSICGSKDIVGSEEKTDNLKRDVITESHSLDDLNLMANALITTPSTDTLPSTPSSLPSTPHRSPSLPSSPITADTPNRTNELLDNTMDISPINSRTNSEENISVPKTIQINFDELEKINEEETQSLEIVPMHQIHGLVDKVQNIVNDENTNVFEESNSPNEYESIGALSEADSTSMKSNESITMLNEGDEINNQNGQIDDSKAKDNNFNLKEGYEVQDKSKIQYKPFLKKRLGVISSPSTMRIKKLLINLGQKPQENTDVPEKFSENDILTFSRELPSPLAVPRSSILKRKFSDSSDGEGISPCPKRKRVNFSDPCLTSKKIFLKDEYQPSLEAKCLFDNSSEPKTTEERLKAIFDCPESLPCSESNETDSDLPDTEISFTNPLIIQTKSIYPKLVDCNDDVSIIVKKITSPMIVPSLINKLKGKNVLTIGDLAKLKETEINRFPFKAPVVSNVLKALDNYYKKKYGDEIMQDKVEGNQNGEVENLDVKSAFEILIKRASQENVSSEELAAILLPQINESKIQHLIKSHFPALKLGNSEKEDHLGTWITSTEVPEIFKQLHNYCHNNDKEADLLQSIFDYIKYKIPLEKFFEGRSVIDLVQGIEKSVKNKVFEKNEIINVLISLVSNEDFEKIVIERLKNGNAEDFIKSIIKNEEIKSNKILETVWCQQPPSTSLELVNCFKSKIDSLSKQEKDESLINMFKYISENLESKTLLDLHVGFLNKLSENLDHKK